MREEKNQVCRFVQHKILHRIGKNFFPPTFLWDENFDLGILETTSLK